MNKKHSKAEALRLLMMFSKPSNETGIKGVKAGLMFIYKHDNDIVYDAVFDSFDNTITASGFNQTIGKQIFKSTVYLTRNVFQSIRDEFYKCNFEG